ncbi:MAG: pyridoxamine 5'-phosphate oxidase family protein [Dehalococcoidia bacterium]|nr:pyridoxamine 5'-phosphate oxidase family protein [Dehalococcoidia bacterium]
MRRKEFEQHEQRAIEVLLDSAGHGFLAFVRPNLTPGAIAVNFVRLDSTIYFHGSPQGEKMEALAANPEVAFMVAEAMSLIPSYFSASDLACPASQFFRSVVVRGRARIVEDLAEKATALQALMEKLQPEGGYLPISQTSTRYRKQLRATAVVAIPMDDVTAKFKLGQNLPRSRRASIARQLTERDAPGDSETAAAMAKARPFN